MKWNCVKCKAINAQFADKCHNCGLTQFEQLQIALSCAPFFMWITCPFCKDEDASEDAEDAAVAHGRVTCRSCNKEFGAKFDEEKDGFFCSPIMKL